MAKVTGPLFSITARGQIGKSIIYSKWKNIYYAKSYAVPTQPNTPAQLAVRDKIRQLAQIWSNPDPIHILRSFHDYWNLWTMMHELSITGYNLFIRTYFPYDLDTVAILYLASAREGEDACSPDQTGIWGYCSIPGAKLHFHNEDTDKSVDITVDDGKYFDTCVPATDFPAHTWVRVTCIDHPMPTIRFKVFDYDFEWG